MGRYWDKRRFSFWEHHDMATACGKIHDTRLYHVRRVSSNELLGSNFICDAGRNHHPCICQSKAQTKLISSLRNSAPDSYRDAGNNWADYYLAAWPTPPWLRVKAAAINSSADFATTAEKKYIKNPIDLSGSCCTKRFIFSRTSKGHF